MQVATIPPIMSRRAISVLALSACVLSRSAETQGQDTIQSRKLDDCLVAAFKQASHGWSSDEVLLQDDLNRAFLEACRQQLPDASPAELNWRLLALRKQGKLNVRASKRRREDHQSYAAAAEIVARRMEDRHGVGTDRILCDPLLRAEFDAEAHALSPHVEPYLLRKAALGLRKARQLKPELISRVADWDRRITVLPLTDLRAAPNDIPTTPGVYIFSHRDGYLYIGESQNLRARISQHLDESNEAALVSLFSNSDIPLESIQVELHAFSPQSPATQVRLRRAYESQLIESRQPQFNIRP